LQALHQMLESLLQPRPILNQKGMENLQGPEIPLRIPSAIQGPQLALLDFALDPIGSDASPGSHERTSAARDPEAPIDRLRLASSPGGVEGNI